MKTEIGEIPVPPKYAGADFIRQSFWKLRGKLDVPKERWVSYPGAERTVDPTLVLAWAGWNHLQQAQAVAAHYETLRNDGASEAQLARLLASLNELLPWLRQWHNEIDPTYGERMGDFFTTFVRQEAERLELTEEDLREIACAGAQAKTKAKRSAKPTPVQPDPVPAKLDDFLAIDLSKLPGKRRDKLSGDDSHWALFVYHFLQQLPESATLPLLEETWDVLSRRAQHALEVSNAIGEDTYAQWDATFKQEMPITGFYPYLTDLHREGWINVEQDTWRITVPSNSALLDLPPDKLRAYDVVVALKVVARRVADRGAMTAPAMEREPTEPTLVQVFEEYFAA